MGNLYARCRRCKQEKTPSAERLCLECQPVAETRIRRYNKCAGCRSEKPLDSQRYCKICRETPEYRNRAAAWQREFRRREIAAGVPLGGTRAQEAAQARRYRAKYPHVTEAQRTKQRHKRLIVLGALGGECLCCHEANFEFLQIDHVYGDGWRDRKTHGRKNTVQWLFRELRGNVPEGFRILCGHCHNAVSTYGYCPHDPERIKLEERPTAVAESSSTLREP